eukprot:TRINITY_DN812_c0_g2_i14.p1 TRINITY_DN812_c0_g2~~TRINITY_DN812_c0_g2_i14.p1  ORF type:complete len:4409 (+),score=1027.50 TRINITY_DN812_c0_g2_i14:338-13564(+)
MTGRRPKVGRDGGGGGGTGGNGTSGNNPHRPGSFVMRTESSAPKRMKRSGRPNPLDDQYMVNDTPGSIDSAHAVTPVRSSSSNLSRFPLQRQGSSAGTRMPARNSSTTSSTTQQQQPRRLVRLDSKRRLRREGSSGLSISSTSPTSTSPGASSSPGAGKSSKKSPSKSGLSQGHTAAELENEAYQMAAMMDSPASTDLLIEELSSSDEEELEAVRGFEPLRSSKPQMAHNVPVDTSHDAGLGRESSVRNLPTIAQASSNLKKQQSSALLRQATLKHLGSSFRLAGADKSSSLLPQGAAAPVTPSKTTGDSGIYRTVSTPADVAAAAAAIAADKTNASNATSANATTTTTTPMRGGRLAPLAAPGTVETSPPVPGPAVTPPAGGGPRPIPAIKPLPHLIDEDPVGARFDFTAIEQYAVYLGSLSSPLTEQQRAALKPFQLLVLHPDRVPAIDEIRSSKKIYVAKVDLVHDTKVMQKKRNLQVHSPMLDALAVPPTDPATPPSKPPNPTQMPFISKRAREVSSVGLESDNMIVSHTAAAAASKKRVFNQLQVTLPPGVSGSRSLSLRRDSVTLNAPHTPAHLAVHPALALGADEDELGLDIDVINEDATSSMTALGGGGGGGGAGSSNSKLIQGQSPPLRRRGQHTSSSTITAAAAAADGGNVDAVAAAELSAKPVTRKVMKKSESKQGVGLTPTSASSAGAGGNSGGPSPDVSPDVPRRNKVTRTSSTSGHLASSSKSQSSLLSSSAAGAARSGPVGADREKSPFGNTSILPAPPFAQHGPPAVVAEILSVLQRGFDGFYLRGIDSAISQRSEADVAHDLVWIFHQVVVVHKRYPVILVEGGARIFKVIKKWIHGIIVLNSTMSVTGEYRPMFGRAWRQYDEFLNLLKQEMSRRADFLAMAYERVKEVQPELLERFFKFCSDRHLIGWISPDLSSCDIDKLRPMTRGITPLGLLDSPPVQTFLARYRNSELATFLDVGGRLKGATTAIGVGGTDYQLIDEMVRDLHVIPTYDMQNNLLHVGSSGGDGGAISVVHPSEIIDATVKAFRDMKAQLAKLSETACHTAYIHTQWLASSASAYQAVSSALQSTAPMQAEIAMLLEDLAQYENWVIGEAQSGAPQPQGTPGDDVDDQDDSLNDSTASVLEGLRQKPARQQDNDGFNIARDDNAAARMRAKAKVRKLRKNVRGVLSSAAASNTASSSLSTMPPAMASSPFNPRGEATGAEEEEDYYGRVQTCQKVIGQSHKEVEFRHVLRLQQTLRSNNLLIDYSANRNIEENFGDDSVNEVRFIPDAKFVKVMAKIDEILTLPERNTTILLAFKESREDVGNSRVVQVLRQLRRDLQREVQVGAGGGQAPMKAVQLWGCDKIGLQFPTQTDTKRYDSVAETSSRVLHVYMRRDHVNPTEAVLNAYFQRAGFSSTEAVLLEGLAREAKAAPTDSKPEWSVMSDRIRQQVRTCSMYELAGLVQRYQDEEEKVMQGPLRFPVKALGKILAKEVTVAAEKRLLDDVLTKEQISERSRLLLRPYKPPKTHPLFVRELREKIANLVTRAAWQEEYRSVLSELFHVLSEGISICGTHSAASAFVATVFTSVCRNLGVNQLEYQIRDHNPYLIREPDVCTVYLEMAGRTDHDIERMFEMEKHTLGAILYERIRQHSIQEDPHPDQFKAHLDHVEDDDRRGVFSAAYVQKFLDGIFFMLPFTINLLLALITGIGIYTSDQIQVEYRVISGSAILLAFVVTGGGTAALGSMVSYYLYQWSFAIVFVLGMRLVTAVLTVTFIAALVASAITWAVRTHVHAGWMMAYVMAFAVLQTLSAALYNTHLGSIWTSREGKAMLAGTVLNFVVVYGLYIFVDDSVISRMTVHMLGLLVNILLLLVCYLTFGHKLVTMFQKLRPTPTSKVLKFYRKNGGPPIPPGGLKKTSQPKGKQYTRANVDVTPTIRHRSAAEEGYFPGADTAVPARRRMGGGGDGGGGGGHKRAASTGAAALASEMSAPDILPANSPLSRGADSHHHRAASALPPSDIHKPQGVDVTPQKTADGKVEPLLKQDASDDNELLDWYQRFCQWRGDGPNANPLQLPRHIVLERATKAAAEVTHEAWKFFRRRVDKSVKSRSKVSRVFCCSSSEERDEVRRRREDRDAETLLIKWYAALIDKPLPKPCTLVWDRMLADALVTVQVKQKTDKVHRFGALWEISRAQLAHGTFYYILLFLDRFLRLASGAGFEFLVSTSDYEIGMMWSQVFFLMAIGTVEPVIHRLKAAEEAAGKTVLGDAHLTLEEVIRARVKRRQDQFRRELLTAYKMALVCLVLVIGMILAVHGLEIREEAVWVFALGVLSYTGFFTGAFNQTFISASQSRHSGTAIVKGTLVGAICGGAGIAVTWQVESTFQKILPGGLWRNISIFGLFIGSWAYAYFSLDGLRLARAMTMAVDDHDKAPLLGSAMQTSGQRWIGSRPDFSDADMEELCHRLEQDSESVRTSPDAATGQIATAYLRNAITRLAALPPTSTLLAAFPEATTEIREILSLWTSGSIVVTLVPEGHLALPTGQLFSAMSYVENVDPDPKKRNTSSWSSKNSSSKKKASSSSKGRRASILKVADAPHRNVHELDAQTAVDLSASRAGRFAPANYPGRSIVARQEQEHRRLRESPHLAAMQGGRGRSPSPEMREIDSLLREAMEVKEAEAENQQPRMVRRLHVFVGVNETDSAQTWAQQLVEGLVHEVYENLWEQGHKTATIAEMLVMSDVIPTRVIRQLNALSDTELFAMEDKSDDVILQHLLLGENINHGWELIPSDARRVLMSIIQYLDPDWDAPCVNDTDLRYHSGLSLEQYQYAVSIINKPVDNVQYPWLRTVAVIHNLVKLARSVKLHIATILEGRHITLSEIHVPVQPHQLKSKKEVPVFGERDDDDLLAFLDNFPHRLTWAQRILQPIDTLCRLCASSLLGEPAYQRERTYASGVPRRRGGIPLGFAWFFRYPMTWFHLFCSAISGWIVWLPIRWFRSAPRLLLQQLRNGLNRTISVEKGKIKWVQRHFADDPVTFFAEWDRNQVVRVEKHSGTMTKLPIKSNKTLKSVMTYDDADARSGSKQVRIEREYAQGSIIRTGFYLYDNANSEIPSRKMIFKGNQPFCDPENTIDHVATLVYDSDGLVKSAELRRAIPHLRSQFSHLVENQVVIEAEYTMDSSRHPSDRRAVRVVYRNVPCESGLTGTLVIIYHEFTSNIKMVRWRPHDDAHWYEALFTYDHLQHPSITTTEITDSGERRSHENINVITQDTFYLVNIPAVTGIWDENVILSLRELPRRFHWTNPFTRNGIRRIYTGKYPTRKSRMILWRAWGAGVIEGVYAQELDEEVLRSEPLLKPYWKYRDWGRTDKAVTYLAMNEQEIAPVVGIAGTPDTRSHLILKIPDLLLLGTGGESHSMETLSTYRSQHILTANTGAGAAHTEQSPLYCFGLDSGTWPADGGGVASCRRDLVDRLSRVRWNQVSELGHNMKVVQRDYQVDRNVQSLTFIHLWGSELGGPNESILSETAYGLLSAKRWRTTDAVIHQYFIPLLRQLVSFVDQREFTTKQCDHVARIFVNLYLFWQNFDWTTSWEHPAVHFAWRKMWMRKEHERARSEPLFRAEKPTVDEVDFVRALFVHFLLPLTVPIPKHTTVVHASHHGIQTLLGVCAQRLMNATLIIWDHGVLWRERIIALSEIHQYSLFVRNVMCDLTRLSVKINFHAANMVAPVCLANVPWETRMGAGASDARKVAFRRHVSPVLNGMEVDRFYVDRAAEDLRPTAVMLSHVYGLKDIKTAIMAAKVIVHDFKISDYQLIICGSLDKDIDYVEECRALILSERLFENVTLAGVHSAPAVLPRGWVFLNSSKSEGLPLALGEAGLAGLPIVCTDVGGSREVVTDPLTGFVFGRIVPAQDPHALACGQIEVLAMLGDLDPVHYEDDEDTIPVTPRDDALPGMMGDNSPDVSASSSAYASNTFEGRMMRQMSPAPQYETATAPVKRQADERPSAPAPTTVGTAAGDMPVSASVAALDTLMPRLATETGHYDDNDNDKMAKTTPSPAPRFAGVLNSSGQRVDPPFGDSEHRRSASAMDVMEGSDGQQVTVDTDAMPSLLGAATAASQAAGGGNGGGVKGKGRALPHEGARRQHSLLGPNRTLTTADTLAVPGAAGTAGAHQRSASASPSSGLGSHRRSASRLASPSPFSPIPATHRANVDAGHAMPDTTSPHPVGSPKKVLHSAIGQHDSKAIKGHSIEDYVPVTDDGAALYQRINEMKLARRVLGMNFRAFVLSSFSMDRYLREHEQQLWIADMRSREKQAANDDINPLKYVNLLQKSLIEPHHAKERRVMALAGRGYHVGGPATPQPTPQQGRSPSGYMYVALLPVTLDREVYSLSFSRLFSPCSICHAWLISLSLPPSLSLSSGRCPRLPP